MNLQDFLTQLPALQEEQALHDARAHAQVLRWPERQRLGHFTFHFGKYLPSLVRARAYTPRIGADCLIVTLAMANTLQFALNLHVHFEQYRECVDEKLPADLFFETFSHMCKLAESAEHGESLPYAEEWHSCVLSWLYAQLWWVEHIPYDLGDVIRKRWKDVEGQRPTT